MAMIDIKEMQQAEKKAPTSKVFNGKKYKRGHGFASKTQAQQSAEIWFRSAGDLARVVKIGKFYFVYVYQ